jgi:hypothetical protein
MTDGILIRLTAVERDLTRMESLWRSSVDDIKATIKSEVSDLKSEQIAELRKRLEIIDNRLTVLEKDQAEISGGKTALAWFIRITIAIAAMLVGFLGGRHT